MNTTHTMTLGSAAPVHGWRGFARRAGATLAAWVDRHRARRALAALDARMLRDIGVSPAEQRRQCAKPFWRE